MTGLKDIKICTDKPHKIIIWPVAPSEANGLKSTGKPQQTREDLTNNEHISVLEYYEFKNDSDSVDFYESWAQVS